MLLLLLLSDTIDGSPLGSPVPGIFQARALEWVVIAFSKFLVCFLFIILLSYPFMWRCSCPFRSLRSSASNNSVRIVSYEHVFLLYLWEEVNLTIYYSAVLIAPFISIGSFDEILKFCFFFFFLLSFYIISLLG